MTECERIIKEGILPKSFFEPETICDFYVDEKRKKIWAILIDLLAKFDSVCRKHGLRYWVSCGGLLGIVRHNGFIPWDDDLDVSMLREDYEKLIRLGHEFENPYFLQIPCQDDGYFYSFAKLRNSNTTAFSKVFRYQNYNMGCMLDIFPMDNCDVNDAEKNYCRIKELALANSLNMRRSNPYLGPEDLKRIAETPWVDPILVFKELDSIAQSHSKEETEFTTLAVSTIFHWRKNLIPKRIFDELKEVDFYGVKTFIPSNYDYVLSTNYGKYMEFPPLESRGLWHDGAYFDPDIPYKETVKRLRNEDLRK